MMKRHFAFPFFVGAFFLLAGALYGAVDNNVDDDVTPPLSGAELRTNIEEEIGSLDGRLDAVEAEPDTPPEPVMITGDVTNNNASANTIASVTGLEFPVTSGGTYRFRFFIKYTAAATTTGSRWSITGPAITSLFYRSDYALTSTSRTFNEGLSAYDNPASSNATSAATGSNIAVVEGIITPSATGTVTARFASEVSASAIVAKAGSFVQYERIDD